VSVTPLDEPGDAGPVSAAMSMLRSGQDGGRRARLGQALATAVMLHQVGRSVTRYVVGKRAAVRYQVAVYDNDALYRPVQEWVLDQMPERSQRALIARTERDGRPVPVGPGAIGPARDRRLELHFDGTRAQQVTIEGRRVLVVIEREGADAARSGDGESSRSYSWRPSRVVFSCQDLVGKQAVIRFLSGLNDDLAKGGDPTLYVLGRWGEWHQTRLRPRPLDSVVLAGDQLERIVGDLQGFYAAEDRYVELGIPWHRGYLFEGPPGTGKTSTVRAIAGHLGLDVYHVPLSDVRADADLPRILSQVGQGLLLLEDVDVATAARDRNANDDQGLTTSGLLQALDGVVTPHGLVTIMTTNRRDVLDAALLRPGRADLIERMDFLTDEQLDRLLVRMVGAGRTYGTPEVSPTRLRLAPADVIELVLRHLDDPGAVPEAVADVLRTRRLSESGTYGSPVGGNHR
jgi:hypothetical protein